MREAERTRTSEASFIFCTVIICATEQRRLIFSFQLQVLPSTSSLLQVFCIIIFQGG